MKNEYRTSILKSFHKEDFRVYLSRIDFFDIYYRVHVTNNDGHDLTCKYFDDYDTAEAYYYSLY